MYNVMIVEDDPMVAMLNKKYVERNKNFHVAGLFRGGKSALKFLEENPVDLIILDVYMPSMDGFETLRHIRKNQQSVDVIMVTAANDSNSVEEALHLGVVDYLVKPFTFDRFQTALDKFIAQREIFDGREKLNQKNIDCIIEANKRKTEEAPKGIQAKTLEILTSYLSEHKGVWLASETIASATGLTPITVRRYMNYLENSGKVIGRMNYETGGRPCMVYCLEE